MSDLRLEARDFAGPGKWRWVLTGPRGEFVADHEVRLDTGCWQFEAFTGLARYLRWRVSPDRRLAHEAEIVADVGVWIGEQVLGKVGAAMAAARPATVRVVVPADPPEAAQLMFVPLELGRSRGRPLASQNVTLVMQHGADGSAPPAVPVGERLRVLGLFSMPTGGRPLNLRRERQALVQLFAEIGGLDRAVDVRILQYGVTRQRLRDALEEGEGWDLIHVSGHGAPGELVLETEDGSPDRVTAAELVDLLDLAQERVKLVLVSACWSAALTLAEQRRLLKLPTRDNIRADYAETGLTVELRRAGDLEPERADGLNAAEGVAAALVDRLGCGVLAMRYPVVDDFAIALAERLYELLARKGQTLPRALGIALKDRAVVADPPTAGCPALSVATPALFGARAVGLRLAAPQRSGPISYDTGSLKLSRFPPQPDRLVGRTAVMARASQALAPRSGSAGVLLSGMPGGGKTACALELAYTHEHAFERLVWFKAPDEGLDIADALTRFALSLETRLPGLKMAHMLEDQARLAAFLPELTELLKRYRVLIVVDNIESLLTESGQWRDTRWESVAAAMTGHSGLGRVVLTSRRTPRDLDGRVRALTVDALSPDEALLLARELPHLSALMDGNMTGVAPDVARRLAVKMLEATHGHPKLLELADGQAARPERLREFMDAADAAWQEVGGLPAGFFTTGETQATGRDYSHVLTAWTKVAAAMLAPSDRDLLYLLCCLEEADRIRPVLEVNWTARWQRLGRAGEPPDLNRGLTHLAAAGLTAIQPSRPQVAEEYAIHPAIALAGRDLAGDRFQKTVDIGLAIYWTSLSDEARGREQHEQTSGMVIRASLGAAPYLLRLHQWEIAAKLLEFALTRDHSTAAARAALPGLSSVAAAVAGTDFEPTATGMLALALAQIDPAAAEQQTTQVLAWALERQDYRTASSAASNLVVSSARAGRLDEALRLADQMADYTQQAGLGPWIQLLAEVRRLQVLSTMGQPGKALAEVQRLREHMETLPSTSEELDTVPAWSVREQLLATGREAALRLRDWDQALELNAAVVECMRDHGAPPAEIARARYSDYGPMIELNRVGEASEMLMECREVFERAHDIEMLGHIFGGLAAAEDTQGRGDVAVDLAGEALRYSYLVGDMDNIWISHHNLGKYLHDSVGQPGRALAHHLAAALLWALTGAEGTNESMPAAADDLKADGDASVPADVADLCRRVADVPGVDLDRLLAGLCPDPQEVQRTLGELKDALRG
jgi:tetratricopeptide (TPR) repeat protein